MADTRLYIAKNTGRNQVSIDEIIHTHWFFNRFCTMYNDPVAFGDLKDAVCPF
jgi:hypothetical protein